MKQTCSAICFVIFLLLAPRYSHAIYYINNTVAELDSQTNWSTLFQTATSQSPSTSYFGAYVFHPIGANLYIGLANYRPADAGISMVAKFNGTTTSSIGVLDEEGVNELVSIGSTLIVSGVDPHDDWTLGNIYTYTGTTFAKNRTGNGLTNVIHMWGLQVDDDGTLYAATSAHDGSFPDTCTLGVTCFGKIFKSVNNGSTWSAVSVLGDYRVFDIIRVNSKLYALSVNDSSSDATLSVSTNNGDSWTTLKSDGGLRRTHMIEFNNEVLVLGGGSANNMLFSIDTNNTITSHSLSFSIGQFYNDVSTYSNSNQFVVASDGYLYTTTDDGIIMRLQNFSSNWETVAATEKDIISLGYWTDRNWLLLGEGGTGSKVWYIDLDNNNPDIVEPQAQSLSSSASESRRIEWTTNENSSSQVSYGFTQSLGSSTSITDTTPRVTTHSVLITGLEECKLYYYQISSVDDSDNETTSEIESFTTNSCT